MAKEMAKPRIADLPEKAKSSYQTSRQTAMEWEKGIEASIRERPLRALLIAAGIGVMFSLLWFRK